MPGSPTERIFAEVVTTAPHGPSWSGLCMSNAVVRASVQRASWFPRDGSSAEDEVGGGTGVGRDGLQQ